MPETVSPENQKNYHIVVSKHLQPKLGSIRKQRLPVQAIETFYATLSEARYPRLSPEMSPRPLVGPKANQAVGMDYRESSRGRHCAADGP